MVGKTVSVNLSKKFILGSDRDSNIQIGFKERELFLKGIPEGDKLEYFARDFKTKKLFIVVHSNRKEDYYGSFKLHFGDQEGFSEAEVLSVDRYRDGGTTYIFYTFLGGEGELYFPAPNKRKKPTNTYKGKKMKLERLI